MFRRNSIILVAALALGVLLSACGSNELAEDLTPIPTLPAGQEPALAEAITNGNAQQGAASDDPAVAEGQDLWASLGCSGCHQAEDSPAAPGVNLMAGRAPDRKEGLSAEEYLHESIVEPDAFVAPPYERPMPNLGVTDEQANSLVAFILFTGGGSSTAEGTAEAPSGTEQAPVAEATAEATEEAAAEGDPDAGSTLFADTCSGCHGEEDGAGPALVGDNNRTEDHAQATDQELIDYLHQSIVDPSAYVVPDFSDIMPKTYDEQFSDEQIADLIAYLMQQ
ncbi:MAG TPA: cytochrome c [Aggregatilineaceae bacterium]|nr:cytochrome c [Aggregatilineaceae bacterium]